jgi:hypothetical protein
MVPINMVHGRACLRVRVRAEGRCYNAAHKPVTRLPATAKANPFIALVVYKGLHYPCLCMFQALDPAHVATQITGIAFNLSPFLTRQIFNSIHGFSLLLS